MGKRFIIIAISVLFTLVLCKCAAIIFFILFPQISFPPFLSMVNGISPLACTPGDESSDPGRGKADDDDDTIPPGDSDDDSVNDDDSGNDDEADFGYEACRDRCNLLLDTNEGRKYLEDPSFDECMSGCQADEMEYHCYRHKVTQDNGDRDGSDCKPLERVCFALDCDPDYTVFVPTPAWSSDVCEGYW